MSDKRVTHRMIAAAVQSLNARRGLTYPQVGYLQYADIRGDGHGYRPGFYAVCNENGGVVNVGSMYRKATLRETLAHIVTLR